MNNRRRGDGDDASGRRQQLADSVIAMTADILEKGRRLQARVRDSDREAPGNPFSEHMVERSEQASRLWTQLLDDRWVEGAPVGDLLTAYALAIEHSLLDLSAKDAANRLRSRLGIPEL